MNDVTKVSAGDWPGDYVRGLNAAAQRVMAMAEEERANARGMMGGARATALERAGKALIAMRDEAAASAVTDGVMKAEWPSLDKLQLQEPLDRIAGCTLGCYEFGQCKANAHGVPSECPARNAGVERTGDAQAK